MTTDTTKAATAATLPSPGKRELEFHNGELERAREVVARALREMRPGVIAYKVDVGALVIAEKMIEELTRAGWPARLGSDAFWGNRLVVLSWPLGPPR